MVVASGRERDFLSKVSGAPAEVAVVTAGPLLRPELWVEPWHDSVTEANGFAPMSAYVEVCYLPILGPTSTMLFRRLGTWAIQEPDGFVVDAVELSQCMGLGKGTSPNSPLARSIGRLEQYGIANASGETLAIRRAVPPLGGRNAARLPRSAADYHRQAVRELVS